MSFDKRIDILGSRDHWSQFCRAMRKHRLCDARCEKCLVQFAYDVQQECNNKHYYIGQGVQFMSRNGKR